jgi:hypothetical protein
VIHEAGKKHTQSRLIEPTIIDCLFVDGVEPRLSEDGGVVVTIKWVDCPVVDERRVVSRTAMSRGEAESYCRRLMALLGIAAGAMFFRFAGAKIHLLDILLPGLT